MFKRKKKDITSLTEDYYQKKETTKLTLCKDVYEIGKSGILTASLGALCFGSSFGFSFGAYIISDRFITNDARLSDDAIPLIFFLGVSALASGLGTKFMYGLAKQECSLLKRHYEEYEIRKHHKLFKTEI